ncbi:MAG TPA: hypothetical protein ENN51_07815, partial [candidate division WOR-3 bacterium]|nr:hypothetical protein [candidate division WOR-3 bacterium]
EYTSSTTDPNRDAVRYVFDWDDDSQDTTEYLASGALVTKAHTWTEVGTYALRVKAQDERGNWSADWSDALEVVVYLDGENNPPDPPTTPTGPDSTGTGVTVTFTTTATDPDGDAVQVRFSWGDGDTSAWSALAPGGSEFSAGHQYITRGPKQVRAQARDADGAESSWSDPATITVYGANTPPGPPMVTGPARGIIEGPMYLFFASARDPEGDDVEYKFFWGDGTASAWTAAQREGLPVPDSTRYAAVGSYQIRAIARDILGAVSDTSEPFTFQVVGEGEVLWAVSVEECISSPAFATVRDAGARMRPAIIIANSDGRVLAVDAWQGTELYDLTLEESEGFNSSPAVSADGNSFYIGARSGQLFAFNNLERREKWTSPWPDSASDQDLGATPAVDGQSIYCAGEDGYLFKVNDDGTGASPVWSSPFRAREEIYSSPVLANDRVIVCDDSGYVYFLNPADGQVMNDFKCDDGIVASPAIGADGTVYVGTDQGTMYAIAPDGSERWNYPITPFAQIYGSAVIAVDGGIVFGADNGYLYKLNAGTGQVMPGWPVMVTAGGLATTPAVSADGVIYVTSDDDVLHAVAQDGTVLWTVTLDMPGLRLSTDELSPSVMIDQHGIIYAASTTDGLFAIAGRGPAGRLAATAWPMFQHDVRHSGKAGSW